MLCVDGMSLFVFESLQCTVVHCSSLLLPIDCTNAPTPHPQGKLQKHEAFEGEVTANEERVFSLMELGQGDVASDEFISPSV